jgi:hypothetical protein
VPATDAHEKRLDQAKGGLDYDSDAGGELTDPFRADVEAPNV